MDLGLGPGVSVGGYRIVRILGSGGMGVVHEAFDPALGRPVALKVIAPHLAAEPSFRSRFTREARALAALDSAHVVQVHTHGEDAGRLFLVTQLVTGGDLGALLREEGPVPVAAAVDLMAQVAAGLADAHAAGIVHRDLKPSNVLLRRRGDRLPHAHHAYLADFGVARRVPPVADWPGDRGGAGTPAYMAPELHAGAEAGYASDVYALGCLLWTTLTGRPPYAAPTDAAIATAHRDRPVPQLAGRQRMVVEVNRILRRSLAKDARDRYGTAAELRDDLRRVAAMPGPAGPVEVADPDARARSPHRLLLALVVLTVLALLVTGATVALSYDDAGDGRPPSAGDRVTATDSLAAALEAQGVLTRAEASCAARRWIGAVGLDGLAEAGLLDAEWHYVDRPADELSPAMARAAERAVLACAG